MADVEESLTNKLGPFPAWVWGAIVVVAVWFFYLWKKRSNPTPVAVAPVVDSTLTAPSAVGNAPGTNTWDGTTTGVQGVQVSTNASWAKTAADALISLGGDPSAVSNALSNFLAGKPLDPTQQAIVNQSLQRYGTPPNGVMPVSPGQEASAYTGHTYTTQAGDTFDSILKKFYNDAPGSAGSAVAAARISAANGLQWNAATKSYDIKPGQTLKLYQDSAVGIQDSTFHWTGV